MEWRTPSSAGRATARLTPRADESVRPSKPGTIPSLARSSLRGVRMERDEAAFTAVVEERKDSLVNYLTHVTRSRDRAEEIAQDAFVRFYRSGWVTRTDEQLVPYLFRIATNLSISQLRREKRWQRLLPFLTAREERSAP